MDERFWSKVDTSPGPLACWPWKASRNKDGYGWYRVNGKMTRAHRVAAGALGVRRCVLHSCDNPPCCNPAHLRLGDQRENAIDRESRGRGRDSRGVKNGRAVLTDGDVRWMRWARAYAGVSYERLGQPFGVSKSTARLAVAGRSWSHVG